MMTRRLCHCWLLFLIANTAVNSAFASSSQLPIYIEDSHAGSFYFLAERLDLDLPHTLLLFDAHSDAARHRLRVLLKMARSTRCRLLRAFGALPHAARVTCIRRVECVGWPAMSKRQRVEWLPRMDSNHEYPYWWIWGS
jgi:hypothetical protein